MRFTFSVTPVNAYLVEGKERVVDRLLCIKDPQAARDTSARLKLWDGLIHFYDRDTKSFPAGLMGKLQARLEKRGHEVVAEYDPPIPKLDPVPADYLIGASMDGDRAYQLDAVNAGLSSGRGIWWLATNAGKSYCISAFVGALWRQKKIRTTVVVPNKHLVHQTSADIKKLLGPDVVVGIVGDGHKETDCHVMVATYQTLVQGVPDDRGRAKNRDIQKFLESCGGIVCDEGHHCASSSLVSILKTASNAVFRIGCTGTVDKSDKSVAKGHESNDKAVEHRWRLEAYLGPVIARVKNEQLIELGISARPRILIVDDPAAFGDVVITPKPTPAEIAAGRRFKNPYVAVFKAAAIDDKTFRRTVCRVVSAMLSQGKAPFVFSHSVAQLKRMKKTLDHFKVPAEILHGNDSMSQRTEVLARFRKRKDFAVLASPILDEGASIPEILGVVLAGSRKSPVELLQRIGRGLRKKAGDNTITVVDFAMPHSTMLNKQFRSRMARFKDEGFDIRRLGAISQLSSVTF